jgi:predicted transcriptional regulator
MSKCPESGSANDGMQSADRGCSQRRIAGELGINREMVDRYLRLAEAKPAISTPGSEEGADSNQPF